MTSCPQAVADVLERVAAAMDRSIIVIHYEFRDTRCSQHIIDPGKFQDALREAARSAGGESGRVTCKTCGAYDATGAFKAYCTAENCPYKPAAPAPAATTTSRTCSDKLPSNCVWRACVEAYKCCGIPETTGPAQPGREPGGRTGDEAGRVMPTASRHKSEAQPPMLGTPQDGASPVPAPLPDAAQVPPICERCGLVLLGSYKDSHHCRPPRTSTPAAPPAQGVGKVPERETAWLVERKVSPPQYITEHSTMPGLSSDPWRAARFVTEREAFDFRLRLASSSLRDECCEIEHVFINKPSSDRPAVPESGLRECPFCGGAARFDPSLAHGDHSVQCEKCRCSTVLVDDRSEARKIWNTRAPSSAQEVTTVGDAEIKCVSAVLGREFGSSPDAKGLAIKILVALTRLQSTGGAGK